MYETNGLLAPDELAACGAQAAEKHRVLFNRFLIPDLGLFIADADGKNERPLVPHGEIEYSPNVSLDGKWVVFTSEHQGLADIYRVHPDGSGLQQLTRDPAFDDQGALSPDNTTLAFVSTREGGTADIWLLDIAKNKYRNLTQNPSGNFRPSWSPDGNGSRSVPIAMPSRVRIRVHGNTCSRSASTSCTRTEQD